MPVTVKVEAEHVLVKTELSTLTRTEATAIADAIKDLSDHRPVVILDFSNVFSADGLALRTLTLVFSAASEKEQTVAVIANRIFEQMVNEQGLERIFKCYASVDDVLDAGKGTATEQGKEHTLEFLNTIMDAIVYIFKVSMNVEVTSGRGVLITAKDPAPAADIGAVVGVIGDPFKGNLAIGFPMATFLACMSRMIGQEYKELHDDIRDGASEILNMVLGQAKAILNEKGYGIRQAIPTTVTGQNLRIHSSAAKFLRVPFDSELGSFHVELSTTSTVKKT